MLSLKRNKTPKKGKGGGEINIYTKKKEGGDKRNKLKRLVITCYMDQASQLEVGFQRPVTN